MSDIHDNYESMLVDCAPITGAPAAAIKTLSGELVTNVSRTDDQVCIVFTARDSSMRVCRIVKHHNAWRLVDNVVIPSPDAPPAQESAVLSWTIPTDRPRGVLAAQTAVACSAGDNWTRNGPRTSDAITRQARLERDIAGCESNIRKAERELEMLRREKDMLETKLLETWDAS